MAYQVDRYNGTFLISVEDGTIDTSTDIRLVGKNYAGYGEIQNENFLHMLENFAGTTAPPRAISGQIWFDSVSKKIKFYDGSKWKTGSGAEVSSAAPTGLSKGDFWWDDVNDQLYSWSGTEFVLIGPESIPDLGASSAVAEVVTDTLGATHSILKLSAGGKVVAIVNKDAAFTLSSADQVEGFTNGIKKGITLVDADINGLTQNDFVFWGTASNSRQFGGFLPQDFIRRTDKLDFKLTIEDDGVEIGDDADILISVQQQDIAVIENQQGNPIRLRITASRDPYVFNDVLIIDNTSVTPDDDAAYTFGAANKRWSNIFSSTFTGNLVGNVTGNVTGDITGSLKAPDGTVIIDASTKQIGYENATIRGRLLGTVVGNVQGDASNSALLDNIAPSTPLPVVTNKTSVPIRDANGKIFASEFIGIASEAVRLKIDNSAVDTDPSFRSAKTSASADTIAARDGSGNLTANLFQGTATAARYADLAEKYLADKEYETGTVVMVGGEAEVTACVSGSRAIGVVSANPAYMMNAELEGGTYIALKGRVPVKVTGPIKKGMRLRAGPDGTAVKAGLQSRTETFAIALESNDDAGVKLIEAVVF